MLKKFAIALALSTLPFGVAAETPQDQIIAQLRAQGFTRIVVSRTWLGRSRILAISPNLRREIVFNPATGNILRDYWTERSPGTSIPGIVDPTQNYSEDDDHEDGDDGDEGDGDEGGDDGGDDGEGGDDGGDDGEGGDDGGDDGGEGGDDGGDGGEGGDDGGSDGGSGGGEGGSDGGSGGGEGGDGDD